MTPESLQRLQNLLWAMLCALPTSIVVLISWVVITTHSNSVSVIDVYDKIDGISRQVEGLKKAGENRDRSLEVRDDNLNQALTKHNLDISEALAEHNREIDGSIANMTGLLEQHGRDISDLKSFVQSLKDQKQVIVVRHAEAEVPMFRATPTPPPMKAAENVLNELLGVVPKHYRSGSGRRPGQPRRAR